MKDTGERGYYYLPPFLNQRRMKRAVAAAAMAAPLFFLPFVGEIMVIASLLAANALFSYVARPARKFSLGVETTTFLTIAVAFWYGSYAGVVFGAAAMIAEYIGSMRLSVYAAATVPAIMLIGLLAPAFKGMDAVSAGVALSVIYSSLTFFLCFLIRRRAFGLLVFAFTNVAFNWLIFSAFGSLLA